MVVDRRTFLGAAIVLPLQEMHARITLNRISLLTDEIAQSPEEAIAFCKRYGVRWVELRAVPGGGGTYAQLDEPVLVSTARELKQAGLRVSFLNTPMLKFTLPGTEPARRRNETPEQRQQREQREKARFERRHEELAKALRAAEIFEVNLVRVFTFTRVSSPETLLPEVAKIVAPMAAEARGRGMKLLVENEGSCNVATAAELRRICELVPDPGLGINWDPVNGLGFQEQAWPDGYQKLPLERLGNVQMKARGLVVGPVLLPWKQIFEALAADGYSGKIGLETHVFDGTLIEKAHLCMREILQLVGEA